MKNEIDVIVAGHTCIDLIPEFYSGGENLTDVLSPGKLVNMGPMLTATGGAVPNTGGAMERFGLKTILVGKVGNDTLGSALTNHIHERGTNTDFIKVSDSDSTSYSVVLSIPGIDRIPLHSPGANDTFGIDDIPKDLLKETKLFHFGYPPLMKNLFIHNGKELAEIFHAAKESGATTSLDMARPDPDSPAGKIDWETYLKTVLPYVDLFHPSIDELVYMIDRDNFEEFDKKLTNGVPIGGITREKLDEYSNRLIDMGTASVVIKLGNYGLYIQVTPDKERLSSGKFGRCYYPAIVNWAGRNLYEACFEAKVAGAIGAGDCTIAGILTGILNCQTLEQASASAAGSGACNVEKPDALSGIPSWNILQQRIDAGWKKETSYL
ncbi:MAG: carbohydrate kinase family protein [Spirochaetales bacterium]|nr:carbohydrate kinase family protein [Spirochaetales bacterium]